MPDTTSEQSYEPSQEERLAAAQAAAADRDARRRLDAAEAELTDLREVALEIADQLQTRDTLAGKQDDTIEGNIDYARPHRSTPTSSDTSSIASDDAAEFKNSEMLKTCVKLAMASAILSKVSQKNNENLAKHHMGHSSTDYSNRIGRALAQVSKFDTNQRTSLSPGMRRIYELIFSMISKLAHKFCNPANVERDFELDIGEDKSFNLHNVLQPNEQEQQELRDKGCLNEIRELIGEKHSFGLMGNTQYLDLDVDVNLTGVSSKIQDDDGVHNAPTAGCGSRKDSSIVG